MNTYQIIFLLLYSFIFAMVEIQIEGTGGWAKNLPTWRIKNPFQKYLGWPTLVDGYHFWTWVLTILVFHAPLFFGFPFTKANEFVIVEMILLSFLIEDFLWFVFNPAWGIKKFFTQEIPWHPHKILYLPQNYWLFFIAFSVFEIVKNFWR